MYGEIRSFWSHTRTLKLGGIARSNYFLVVYRLFYKVVYKVPKSTLKGRRKIKMKKYYASYLAEGEKVEYTPLFSNEELLLDYLKNNNKFLLILRIFGINKKGVI